MTNQYCHRRASAQSVRAANLRIEWLGSPVAERIAGFDLTSRQASLEPRASLRRRSVCKRLGVDSTVCRALNAVVADGGGGVETFFNVTLLENASLLGAMSPDAGEAIGLQFEPHRHGVRVGWVLLLKATSLRIDAEQVLNVMPQLVREDIRFREVAGRAEATL
jgi:hypothetical protein